VKIGSLNLLNKFIYNLITATVVGFWKGGRRSAQKQVYIYIYIYIYLMVVFMKWYIKYKIVNLKLLSNYKIIY
ncbi:MAG: hypothetical protein N7Q72_05880, partial [Spiroplasma sp. Tabriz.8]|nr:hypothetical protein [Spiroplasma sp. Tabriz.8]